jgi:predicted ABC-type ATPase
VRGYYAYVPDPENAVKRSEERAKKTGRAVPESYIRERHRKVSQIFPDAAAKLDSVELYDTSNSAQLVARGERGTLEILDDKAYGEFLSNGGGEL